MMAHVLKDFVAGAFLIAAAFFAGVALLVILFFLGLLFRLLVVLGSALFFLALLGLAVWCVGFAYRKARETRKP
jgi:type IV secretory pathway TrbD component